MAKFDIKTVKPKFVVTTSPENKIDVVVNKPIIETKLSKSFFKLKNTGGPAGPRGEQGERGEPGPQGEQGVPGRDGADGLAATIRVESTSTLPAGYNANVTNVGTTSEARLIFGIPKGDKGDKGDPGAGLVITGSVATYGDLPTNLTPADAGKAYFVQADGKLYVWSGTAFPADGEGSQFEGPKGDPGDPGTAATIAAGTTTTTAPGTNASVQNVGTSSQAIFNFSIPRGDKGEPGVDGTDGADGADGFSPTATVTQTSSGATISITDKNGTTTANVTNGTNGQDGQPGADGFSPTATVTQQGLNADISITDKNGTTTATVPGFGAQVVTSLPATGSENIIYLEREATTASGKFIHITDSAPDSPLEYFNLYGETTQNGTPTPSAPLPVNTVTGENTLQITGKNLLKLKDGEYSWPSASQTWTIANGVINATRSNGTYIGGSLNLATGAMSEWALDCISDSHLTKNGGEYTLSFSRIGDVSDTISTSRLCIVGFIYDSNGNNTSGNGILMVDLPVNSSGTYTLTLDSDKHLGALILYTEHVSYANIELRVQLEYGSTATTYEAFEGQSYEINLGKNLVRQIKDFSANGLIFSTKQDGTTHIQGTSTSQVVNDTDISDIVLNPGTYTFSYSYNGTQPPVNSGAVQLRKYDPESETGTTVVALNAWANASTSFTLTEITKLQVLRIFFNSGQPINCDVSVQLEKGSTASSFAAYFAPIELCKLGTYQDYIYKNGQNWYIHKETGKERVTSFSGSEQADNQKRFSFAVPTGSVTPLDTTNGYIAYSNIVILGAQGSTWSYPNRFTLASNSGLVAITALNSMTTSQANEWLNNNPFIIYYPLASSTDTQITNTALVSQLNNMLNNAVTYDRITNIYTNTENEQGTLGVEYYNAFGSYLYIGGQWYKFSRLTYGE